MERTSWGECDEGVQSYRERGAARGDDFYRGRSPGKCCFLCCNTVGFLCDHKHWRTCKLFAFEESILTFTLGVTLAYLHYSKEYTTGSRAYIYL